jgi:hypothetical protein
LEFKKAQSLRRAYALILVSQKRSLDEFEQKELSSLEKILK